MILVGKYRSTHCNVVRVYFNGCAVLSIFSDSTVLLADHGHAIKPVLSVQCT